MSIFGRCFHFIRLEPARMLSVDLESAIICSRVKAVAFLKCKIDIKMLSSSVAC